MKVLRVVFIALFCVLALAVTGCGSPAAPADQPTVLQQPTAQVATPSAVATAPAAEATSTWVPPTALVGTPIPGAEATLTAAPQLNRATITITNSKGEKTAMTVEVADTDAGRELGLMFRPSMPPDDGMLFDFGADTTSGFWMANTILPLSIAFIKADGTIIDIKDMQPLDRTGIGASGPYRYALEANQGYFRAHNISPGDHVALPGTQQSVVIPGMPSCMK